MPEMAENPLNIDMQPKELDPTFQNKMTDAEKLDEAFKGELCGWRVVSESAEETTITGKKKLVMKLKRVIDYDGRIMNEAGENYVFRAVFPLISVLTTTSVLDAAHIYNNYKIRLKSIKFTLLDSILLEANPYNIIPSKVHEIITFLCSCYLITLSAQKGTKLKQLTETIISSTMNRLNMMPQQSQAGILDRIRSGFMGDKR